MRMHKYLVAAIGLAGMAMAAQTVAFGQTDVCSWSHDVKLINGKIYTMDPKNSIVNEVTIQDGKFTAIGKVPGQKLNTCTRVIDLKGRTVVPGLIDNHNHFIALGLRPGYDVRLETAWTIREVQDRIRERAKTAPPGAFITATAGWAVRQLAEKRMPTLAELDAAAPNNPVYIFPTGPGTAMTNTLGKKFFEEKGIKVDPSGALAGPGGPGGAVGSDAIGALRSIQTFEDEKRGMLDAENYSVSLGLTVDVDQGMAAGFLNGSPDVEDSMMAGPGIETFNPWTWYNAAVELDREGKATARVRIFFYGLDTDMSVPITKERLQNSFLNFGDDMLRPAGFGERAVSAPPPPGGGGVFAFRPLPNEEVALQMIAKYGWTYSEHSTSLAADQYITGMFEKVNAVTPIANLHWSVAHVPKIDEPTLNRLKAIGAGVMPHGWSYMSGNVPPAGAPPVGPPFRMILDNGIHAGAGSDGVGVTALDPWLVIYYMVTGKNSAGEVINPGQQITRMEALRLYTADNGWFFREEDKLGSMEPGKLGDLVVLSADFFDLQKVSDEQIRDIKSVLTVVGGKIVYEAKQ